MLRKGFSVSDEIVEIENSMTFGLVVWGVGVEKALHTKWIH